MRSLLAHYLPFKCDGKIVVRTTSAAVAAMIWVPTFILILSCAHARSSPNDLSSIESCISGDVTDQQADLIGNFIAVRYYDLSFDASIFSLACSKRLAALAFNVFDENASLKLVSFFWTDAFLDRLYDVSSSDNRLTCPIECLLRMDRRPSPSLQLFDKIAANPRKLSAPTDYFLLARALVNHALEPEHLRDLIEHSGRPPDALVKNLFVLEPAYNIRNVFSFGADHLSDICVADLCVTPRSIGDIPSCDALAQYAKATDDLDLAVALKFWIVTNGAAFATSCVEEGLRQPLSSVRQTSIATVFSLSIFNPALRENDLIGGFQSGVFLSFNFLSTDVSRLTNLNLRKLRGFSGSFSREILNQLDNARSELSTISVSDGVALLLANGPWTGAHYRLLRCEAFRSADCDRRSIYLSQISKSLK
jgi:hypothetical protein